MLQNVYIVEPADDGLGDLIEAVEANTPLGCKVRVVRTQQALKRHLKEPDQRRLVLVHVDHGDGKTRGLDLIQRVRELDSNVPILAVADAGDVGSAQEAVSAGATDFLVRGDQLEKRITTVLGKLKNLFSVIERNRALDALNAQLRHDMQARFQLIGRSPQMTAVIDQIQRVAKVPRPVLIVGERGTGKELVARAIHFSAGPANRPIVTVNCAAFPEALLESELFGHERGAFTGADATRQGKFELADGGTLFLDEIGNMPLTFQQKILRVVEYGTFSRVGGHEELKTSARIIAATNCDVQQLIRNGNFLSDLYDRLSFELIEVPPLRERKGDIETLSNHFLYQFAMEIPAFKGKKLSKAALDTLRQYPFPGNVRELKNIIERAAYRDTTNEITPQDFGILQSPDANVLHGSFTEQVDALSKSLIQNAMQQADSNKAEAARLLGLSYHQFRYYHDKYQSI